LQKHDLVRGLPRMSYKDDLLCQTCEKEKQIETSFSSKNFVSTSKPLELLRIDLFGPTRATAIIGKRYSLVAVDGAWIMFLAHKNGSFDIFFKFYRMIQNEKGVCITSIRSDDAILPPKGIG